MRSQVQYHDEQVFAIQGRCAINRPALSTFETLIAVFLAILLLPACQDEGGPERRIIPTAIPPTPTIRSTPLPAVSPAPDLGETEARPIVIQIALFGANPSRDTRSTGVQLQQTLEDELGLAVSVQFVDESTALKSLCSGAPVAAWVSPFTYVQAEADCNVEPVFAVTRGRPTANTGRTAEIVARPDISALSQLGERVFCRSYEFDYFTNWVFPSLYLAAEGVDPLTGLREIKDYPDNMSMGKALYQGDCTAAALPPDEYDDWLIDLSAFLSTRANPVTSRELEDIIRIVQPAAQTSAPRTQPRSWTYDRGIVPYEVLVLAPASALPGELSRANTLRAQVTRTIQRFLSEEASGSERLGALLDARGLLPVNAESYQAFTPVVRDANWNMAYSE